MPSNIPDDSSDEMEYFGGDLKNAIKMIVLRHIERIAVLMCSELTGGYTKRKPIKMATGSFMSEEYEEDKREAFCNAVDWLIMTLTPASDDDFKKNIPLLKEKEKNLISECIKKQDSNIKIAIVRLDVHKAMYEEINTYFYRADYFGRNKIYAERGG